MAKIIRSSDGLFRILGTGSIEIPSGTTAQRPGTPNEGEIRWNTTNNLLEFFTAEGTWLAMVSGPETTASPSSSAGSITFDLSTASVFTVTLTENITNISLINGPVSGTAGGYAIIFTQDALGPWTVSGWPASVKWPGGTAYSATASINAVDMVSLITVDDGTNFYATESGLDFS